MLSYTNAAIALVVIVGIAMLGSAVLNLNMQAPSSALENTPANYQQFAAAELPDKCAVPPGQDPVKWKEHLGHHPDQYAECL
ncbi:MAG: hypothetical protein NUV67_01760 [archaeon]|nr:hypothetical protein [archaeon]